MQANDIRAYDDLLDHLNAARLKTDAIIEEMRDELARLEGREEPAPGDVTTGAMMGEKIINHVLASKYMAEAYGALAFYRAVLKGLADEEDNEYDPDEIPIVPMTDEEIELFESGLDPDELPMTFEIGEDEEEKPCPSDGPTDEDDLPGDGVVLVHDFTKRHQ
ncbi:MAG: hypothetical protein IJR97_13430 [Clostridia bacterium]|nr:hypothetical protein [Clostridia bacterium]